MQFSVPTNWQRGLLENLNKQDVVEIYGKLKSDIVGGGRPSVLSAPVSKSTLAKDIALIHKYGLKFNYLLNSPFLHNMEWTRTGQKKIRSFLDWLSEIGVDCITLSIPYLLELIKKCYSHFGVSVSIFAGIDSPLRARYWEDLGADQITLSFVDMNRNFELIRQIRETVSCRLQLIANLLCLYGCPFYKYHSLMVSQASQTGDIYKGFHIDYCSLSCRYLRLLEPWKMIAAGWIRPEDIDVYKNCGIDRIKLVDRIFKTEAILQIVDAYTKRRWEGNLLDLFSFNANNYLATSRKYLWRKFRVFFRPFKVNLFRLYRARSLLNTNCLYLDNKKLDGFINLFVEGKCNPIDCGKCGYCNSIADKALYIPVGYREKMLKECKEFLNGLLTGSVFSNKE